MRIHAKAAEGDTAAPTPVPTELNVNLCDGGDFRVTEEFLI